MTVDRGHQYASGAAREAEVAAILAAIRAVAAERTGWEPWMTGKVGYAAVDPQSLSGLERRRYMRRLAAAERRKDGRR